MSSEETSNMINWLPDACPHSLQTLLFSHNIYASLYRASSLNRLSWDEVLRLWQKNMAWKKKLQIQKAYFSFCTRLCFGEKQVNVSRWRPAMYSSKFRGSSIFSGSLPRRNYTNEMVKNMNKTNCPLRTYPHIWGCQFYFLHLNLWMYLNCTFAVILYMQGQWLHCFRVKCCQLLSDVPLFQVSGDGPLSHQLLVSHRAVQSQLLELC